MYINKKEVVLTGIYKTSFLFIYNLIQGKLLKNIL